MWDPVLQTNIKGLEKSIEEAKNSGIPMAIDWKQGTAGYKYQRKIWDISVNIRFLATSLNQEWFDKTLDLFQETVKIFEENYYGKCQRVRMISLIQVGLRLNLGIPDKYKSYIPEAMLSMEDSSQL